MLNENENKLGQKDEPVVPVSRPTAISNLSKSQKAMAASLAFFAMAVMILWSMQFKRSLTDGMYGESGNENEESNTAETVEEDTVASLKTKDTDKDGLNDYDELNVYKTSPYLEDSDSDGFSDKKEVDNDQNPNCPAGRQCTASPLVNASAGDESSSTVTTLNTGNTGLDDAAALGALLEGLDATDAGAQTNNTGASTGGNTSAKTDTGLDALLDGNMDAASLRKMLIEQGMDKAMLDKISDEDLVKSYQETLKKQ